MKKCAGHSFSLQPRFPNKQALWALINSNKTIFKVGINDLRVFLKIPLKLHGKDLCNHNFSRQLIISLLYINKTINKIVLKYLINLFLWNLLKSMPEGQLVKVLLKSMLQRPLVILGGLFKVLINKIMPSNLHSKLTTTFHLKTTHSQISGDLLVNKL